jgi:hypothetical protein
MDHSQQQPLHPGVRGQGHEPVIEQEITTDIMRADVGGAHERNDSIIPATSDSS